MVVDKLGLDWLLNSIYYIISISHGVQYSFSKLICLCLKPRACLNDKKILRSSLIFFLTYVLLLSLKATSKFLRSNGDLIKR